MPTEDKGTQAPGTEPTKLAFSEESRRMRVAKTKDGYNVWVFRCRLRLQYFMHETSRTSHYKTSEAFVDPETLWDGKGKQLWKIRVKQEYVKRWPPMSTKDFDKLRKGEVTEPINSPEDESDASNSELDSTDAPNNHEAGEDNDLTMDDYFDGNEISEKYDLRKQKFFDEEDSSDEYDPIASLEAYRAKKVDKNNPLFELRQHIFELRQQVRNGRDGHHDKLAESILKYAESYERTSLILENMARGGTVNTETTATTSSKPTATEENNAA
ncbi:hypothetical protein CC80DRAFT_505425 [Byssothecium circinans]|uniref:Uncharacterized protein n=1 Tax=Byssothecium circinans TaxID=147558 RepID=A0A6A5TU51_9PLEO|nr:hypothetical protein CC80DRAFT_505425 [Byssothecium circinans]